MANRIRALRQEKGIKQIELARAVSVSQAALSGYETGRYEPDFTTLKKIADYFAVSVDYLLGHDETPSPSGSGTAPADQEQLMAAFWGGDQDLTDEDKEAMWADVKNFAAFIAQKKKQEKQQHD